MTARPVLWAQRIQQCAAIVSATCEPRHNGGGECQPPQSTAPAYSVDSSGRLPSSDSMDRSMIDLAPRSVSHPAASGLPVLATTS